MLFIEKVQTYYNQIHALKNVSLKIDEGEIVAILGANGAGKSTILKSIMGFQSCSSGTIQLNGEPIERMRTEQIVARGVAMVFERREMFGRLTVRRNLELGAYSRRKNGQCDKDLLGRDIEQICELFPPLRAKLEVPSMSLSGGQQQMVAIGRALMSRPRLLLLDEPSMGLAPLLIKEIFSKIKELSAAGVSILLVEQNSHDTLQICDRAYILQTGSIALGGTAEELKGNPELARLYLGGTK